jgi:hypothetical protein
VIIVQCDSHAERRYYSLSEAARLVTKNQWGIPCEGIHSETLRRTRRDSKSAHGRVIGRDVYFSREDMVALGYEIDDDFDDTRNKIILEVN